MIQIDRYRDAMSASATFTFASFGNKAITGKFYFGYREDFNRVMADMDVVIIAEWPTWKLTTTGDTAGISVRQRFLFKSKEVTGAATADSAKTETIDYLQGLINYYLARLDTYANIAVVELNKPKDLSISPEGFTTDGSLVLMFDVTIKVFDCVEEVAGEEEVEE